MLGYDVDFGHMEAISLISAPKYPEKQVIQFLYLNCSAIVNTKNWFIKDSHTHHFAVNCLIIKSF